MASLQRDCQLQVCFKCGIWDRVGLPQKTYVVLCLSECQSFWLKFATLLPPNFSCLAFPVANLFSTLLSSLEGRRWMASADGARAAFSAVRATTFIFSSAPRLASQRLIFKLEVRTVKGRDSWGSKIFRSNQGNSQHNPGRSCVPGMALCTLLFRNHFVNFFASFTMS